MIHLHLQVVCHLESHTANLGMISLRELIVHFNVCLYVLHVSAWTKVQELVGLLCSYIYHLSKSIITIKILYPYIVPATPASNVCAVYDKVDGALQIIENTWNELVCT